METYLYITSRPLHWLLRYMYITICICQHTCICIHTCGAVGSSPCRRWSGRGCGCGRTPGGSLPHCTHRSSGKGPPPPAGMIWRGGEEENRTRPMNEGREVRKGDRDHRQRQNDITYYMYCIQTCALSINP